MEIGERLKIFISSTGKNVAQLSRELDLSQTSIKRLIDGHSLPSSKTLIPLIKKYPSLNLYWLLIGEGEMLRGEKEKEIDNSELCRRCKEKDMLIVSLQGKVEVLKELVSARP